MTVLMLVAGGILLVIGAEGLVRGASRLAASVGISPIVIGLTVVAFGTSSPEMAVSVSSGLSGDSDVALGNVVGSNIFNVLLILGITAIVSPLVVHERIIFLEVPLMIAVSVLLYLLVQGGEISRIEGGAIFVGLLAYIVFLIRQSRAEGKDVQAEYEAEYSEKGATPSSKVRDVLFVIGGLGLLVLGSELFVDGAVEIAESFGVSTLVIGLTIVAGGTSLPELATSVIAGIKGERDIAVGNIVGSNIFNILGVLGLTALVSDGGVQAAQVAIDFDIPIMIGVAIILAPVIYSRREVARWEGVLFILYYVAYTAYLILDANDHANARDFRNVMLYIIVPITALAIVVVAVRDFMRNRDSGSSPAAA